MNTMPLKRAVSEIHMIVDQEERSPFVFIVGAGISSPEVPLASEIERHCRERAKKYYYDTPDLPDERPMMERYSHWFQRGYTSAQTRQNYLSSIMAKIGISRANDKLARVLVSNTQKRVATTVFTTNFDEMLSKALELYGERPLICDHPQTVSRMRIDSDKLQIIHVHGSFWFYDCCNLQNEISARSGNAPMLRTLSQALANHSPIVVGYSGWEGDVLMTSLRERLSVGALGTPIYWFSYRRSEIDNLPPWLKDSPDVNFVVSDEAGSCAEQPPDAKQVANTPAASPSRTTTWESAKPTASAAIPAQRGKEVLTADEVFTEIIRQLTLPVPPLVQNPLDFFLKRLQSLDTADRTVAASDDYSFKEVIKRVKAARDAERVGPDSLLPFRAAMSHKDYRRAIQEARGIDFYSLPMADRREALFGLMEAARGLYDNSREEMEGYEDVVVLADLLSEQDQADPGARTQVSDALFCWGLTLDALHRRQEAIAIFDKLVQRFATAQEPVIRQQVAKALFKKGAVLNAMDRHEESLRPYEELVAQFGADRDPVIVENIAGAMFNKGWALVTLKRYVEGVAAYKEVIDRFAAATEQGLEEQVAKSMLNLGLALSALGQGEEEIAVYNALVQRFGASPAQTLRVQVAKALLNKGVTLASLNDPLGAIDAYTDLATRFSEAQELELREQVAKGLLNKGLALSSMERSEEEVDVYADLLQRFDKATEPSLQEQVAKAMFNRGATMAQLNRSAEALALYHQVVQRFAGSGEPSIRLSVAKALLNAAVIEETAGHTELAVNSYEEIIARFNNPEDQALSDYVERARTKLSGLPKAETPTIPQADGILSGSR
jgi:tetratricopeptide (TPR) repeat protein/NAD-dependent SIR2 family protein deacetylase